MGFNVMKIFCKHLCTVFRHGDTSFLQRPVSYLNRPFGSTTCAPDTDAREIKLGPTEALQNLTKSQLHYAYLKARQFEP